MIKTCSPPPTDRWHVELLLPCRIVQRTSLELSDSFMKRLCQVTRFVEAGLVFVDRPPVSAHSPLTQQEKWAREGVTHRQPRRQASFLTPPWRGGSPFYARSKRHGTGRLSLLNSRNENTALHLEVCNTARAVLAVRPTVLSEITDIGGNSAQHRCVERTVVRSVVAGINAAHRLRGDAVVTVMQTANFGNGNNATG